MNFTKMLDPDTMQIFLQIPINKRKDGIINIPGFSEDDILEVEAINKYISADGKYENFLVRKSNNQLISIEFFKEAPELVVEVPIGLKIITKTEEPKFSFYFFHSRKSVYVYLLQGKIRRKTQEGGKMLYHFENPIIDNALQSEINSQRQLIDKLIAENAKLTKELIEVKEEMRMGIVRIVEKAFEKIKTE